MANELVENVTHSWRENNHGNWSDVCCVGFDTFGIENGSNKGALRFDNIAIGNNQSFSLAQLIYKYSTVGTTSGSWKFKVNGIDEDDTAPFGYPFGRPKTSAQLNYDEGEPTSGGTKTMDVNSIISEITSRGGWSTGNAIGFILEDLGSDSDVFAFADLNESYFVYRIAAEPNFKPTPKSVAAPSLPDADDYGIKISKSGESVFTASEADLYFSTRRKQLKVFKEAQVTASAAGPGGNIVVAHNFGYVPFVTVYKNDPLKNNNWRRLPVPNFSTFDNGIAYIDDTNLTIYPAYDGEKFYYYIFYDQVAS